jgi:hypothetical protein
MCIVLNVLIMVRIVDFEATMDKDDLVLKGKCEKCSSNVARLIEG